MKDLFDFDLDKKMENGELSQGNISNASSIRMPLPLPEQYDSKEEVLLIYLPNEESQLKKMSASPQINPYQKVVDDQHCKVQEKNCEDDENVLKQKSSESYKIHKYKKIKKRSKYMISHKPVPQRQKKIIFYNLKDNSSKVAKVNSRSYTAQLAKFSIIKKDKSHSYFHIYGYLYLVVPKKTSSSSKKHLHSIEPSDVTSKPLGPQTKSPFIDRTIDSLHNECDEMEVRLVKKHGSLDNIDPRCQKKQYTCKHCGKPFKKASGLGGHMSKIHPKRLKKSEMIDQEEQEVKQEEKTQQKIKKINDLDNCNAEGNEIKMELFLNEPSM